MKTCSYHGLQHLKSKMSTDILAKICACETITDHPLYAQSTEYKASAKPPTSDAEVTEEPRKGCWMSSVKCPVKKWVTRFGLR